MFSANGNKTAFTEKKLVNATYLSTSTSTAHEEKTKVYEARLRKMSRIQHLCFAVLLVVLLAITVVSATAGKHDPAPADEKTFQELLQSIEPAALHEVLHEHLGDKYKHGVYQEDKTALEVVHKQNAQIASSIVAIAKRQSGPGSNSTVIVTTSVIVSTSTETTGTPTQTPDTTPSETPSNTPTAVTDDTTTTGASASSSQPTTLQTSSSAPVSSAPETATSTTDSASNTSERSSRSSPSVTQSVVYATTLAGGSVTTVTSITVVNADQAASQGNGGSGTNTNTANVSLQTNLASVKPCHLELSACIGAVGLALAWAL